MEKRRLRRKCDQCGIIFDVWRQEDGYYDPHTGEGKVTVLWTPCPFQEEIHGDSTPMWLCDVCYDNNYMDI